MRTALLAGMARGSVSRRSGGWCFRLDAGVRAATGRRHQVSRQAFATKRDAVAALNTALTELNATTSEAVRAGGGTLSEYLADWLEGQGSAFTVCATPTRHSPYDSEPTRCCSANASDTHQSPSLSIATHTSSQASTDTPQTSSPNTSSPSPG